MVYWGEHYSHETGISVSRAGNDVGHEAGFCIDRMEGSGDWDFLHFRTPVVVRSRGGEALCPAGSCIIYSPSFHQRYFSERTGFVHDWFHAEGPALNVLLDSLNLPSDMVFHTTMGERISALVGELVKELFCKDSHWELSVAATLHSLLVVLHRSLHCGDKQAATGHLSHRDNLDEIRRRFLRNPESPRNVAGIAREANLSRSRFSFLYRQRFGVSPMEDVLRARMQKARWLLASTPHAVSDIARRVGFEDHCYFNRLFKKRTGVTPGRYRQSSSYRR